jgi:hypothetical protein
MRLPKVDRELAWFATRNLFICIGGASYVGMLATMHAYLIAAGVAVTGAVWGVLYKMADGLRARKGQKVNA